VIPGVKIESVSKMSLERYYQNCETD
jgi:hypothetical protein